MISSYLMMQNAILAQNTAVASMMSNSDAMRASLNNAGCQPIKPSFAQSCDAMELQNLNNETKVSVLQKFIDAMSEKLGKDIKKSTPKYAGIDYKA
ncbi:MAG: hypothetical protein LUG16_03360 [Candidatus Gastranaerophilales bacterium]|nr:hypothetical protein [Candidatus Gastranaerophilales bacterium]